MAGAMQGPPPSRLPSARLEGGGGEGSGRAMSSVVDSSRGPYTEHFYDLTGGLGTLAYMVRGAWAGIQIQIRA